MRMFILKNGHWAEVQKIGWEKTDQLLRYEWEITYHFSQGSFGDSHKATALTLRGAFGSVRREIAFRKNPAARDVFYKMIGGKI